MNSKYKVPFFKPEISKKELLNVQDCLNSGWLTTGPRVTQFENNFKEFIGGASHTIAVSSATAALHLALESIGIKKEDEVILPTLTFTATAAAVNYLGASPVLIDIDPETLCMDINQLKSHITDKTKAIIPVHFAGRICNLTKIKSIISNKDIKIIDDSAHCLPGFHNGKPIGNCGADITAFSFYANKTITTGEGGMIATNNKKYADRIKIMRLHGINKDVFARYEDNKASWIYDVIAPGYKYNLTDIAASIGLAQLDKAFIFYQKRKRLTDRYTSLLKDMPIKTPPSAIEGDLHSWHLYIIQLQDKLAYKRDKIIQCLRNQGINVSVHYRPLHQMTYWEKYKNGLYPNADNYFQSCITLPLFSSMSFEQQDLVVEALKFSINHAKD